MKKLTIILLSVIGILLLATLVIKIFMPYTEAQINKEIVKAKYCDVKEDCVMADTKCPFGCYTYVNKNEVNRINKLILSYPSNCIYSCMYCPELECKNHTCEPICQQ